MSFQKLFKNSNCFTKRGVKSSNFIHNIQKCLMKTYFGQYVIKPGSEPVESSVLVSDKAISIGYRNNDGVNSTEQWVMRKVEVRFDFGSQATKVRNRDQPGAELIIEGNDAAKFITEMKEELEKPWYRKSGSKEWGRNLLLLFGILGILFLLYLLLVPRLSEAMASKVSVQTEAKLGDAVYNAMGISVFEDSAKSRLLNEFFATMNVKSDYKINITAVNQDVVNAFALPGGRIVVYEALLRKLDSYPELAALLSHEFTHVNNRHSTKSIFRQLGSRIFLALLFGKMGSVTSVLISQADNLKSLTYSRKLEKEADMQGAELLIKRNIDPRGFIGLFNRLKESTTAGSLPEFLASHPDIDKRIESIKEMSKKAVVKENPQLHAIFEKLK